MRRLVGFSVAEAGKRWGYGLSPGCLGLCPEAARETQAEGEAGPTCLPPSPQILAALPVDWRGPHLLACSCLRVVFIPLFILCVYPSGTPALRHPAWPCVLSLLMGISNGYFGSVPMILAAGKVSPKQRELAGKAPAQPLRPTHSPRYQAGHARPVEVRSHRDTCVWVPGPGWPRGS